MKIQLCLLLLKEKDDISYLGAVSERLHLPALSEFVAAKAELEIFVTVLGQEKSRKRVALVYPGVVDTPIWNNFSLRVTPDCVSPEYVSLKI